MNDKKKKKEYVIPEADLIEFGCEDIITESGDHWGDTGIDNHEKWQR